MAMNGTSVVLGVNTGTVGSPVFTALGSQRNLSREEAVEEIDYSTKDSASKVVGGGRYSFSMALDALYVPTSSTFQILKQYFRNRELLKVRIVESGVATEEADVLITQMSEEYPDQAEATISVSLVGSGSWSAV